MEEDRSIQRVGNYSMFQVDPENCTKCKNAKMGTVIIDGLCLDCHDQEINDEWIKRFNESHVNRIYQKT